MPSRIGCQLWHVPFNRKPELLRTSQPRLCNIALDNKQEPIRTVEEIVVKDKAGMIFSPRVGLHENVVVLDYENEYANLIIKHNLSYETGTSIGDSKGLLQTVLESVHKRRMVFKNLQKSFPINSKEWLCCEQRIVTLKNMIVSLYGPTGSFWNRLANVDVFEEINRPWIRTKDNVQGLVYADTDSVFIKSIVQRSRI